MTKIAQAPAALSHAADAAQDNAQPAIKGRRPRRMARESRGQQLVEESDRSERAPSKIDRVLGLLGRVEGATLPEIVEITGWLPHTARATLTGLRKKGHVLLKEKRGNATCYRISEAGQ